MTTAAIYSIVNQKTCDMYVGSSINYKRRWNKHKSTLRRNTHACQHMQNSFNKHGEIAFSFEVIEFVSDVTQIIAREQFWIDFYRPEYNKRAIANSCIGLKRSPEAKARMSAAQKGKKRSAESIVKAANALKGHIVSAETRAKISKSHIGIKPSDEARAKMSAAKKGRKQSPETIAKRMAAIKQKLLAKKEAI